MLVCVFNNKTYRCARGAPFKHTAENFHLVALLSSRDDIALSGTPAVKLMLHLINIHKQSGRHAVYHSAYRSAMTLAESRKAVYVSKTIHRSIRSANEPPT